MPKQRRTPGDFVRLDEDALMPADVVPEIAQAKVTNLESDIASKAASADLAVVATAGTFASLTSKPTTLAGYGITDAASDAELAAHESDTTSVHGIADTSTLYRSGGTDVAVADGGTGASDAATARTNLGAQATLVSGTNIKTINGSSLLGSGDLTVSANIKQAEVDFGTALNQTEKSFTVTDADVSTSSQILASIAYKSPSSGRHIDEVAHESLQVFCAPGTGQFTMLVRSLCGSVSGQFLVNYSVG